MTYRFIADHRASTPVKWMCHALGVSESGSYAWKRRPPRCPSLEDRQLTEQIKEIPQASRKTYGSPRIQAELRVQGRCCRRKRIVRLMRPCGVSAQRKRHRTCTTDSQHSSPVAPHRLHRPFTAERPNEKWVTDITGVWTSQGWLYLAVVLDVFQADA
jgi:transposase InsO family protein